MSQARNPRGITLALFLAVITIVYNLAEGIISIGFGSSDETITLFGFGLDSLIEVISGIGIVHLVLRIRAGKNEDRDRFESTALRITGSAFYILTAGLIGTACLNLWNQHRPESSLASMVIAGISIASMWALMLAKKRAGLEMNSPAVIADANCTKTCIYMSVVLMVSSVAYAWLGLYFIDSIGALALAYYSFSEGKECFEKASNPTHCCDHC